MTPLEPWDLPDPFVAELAVQPADIDAYEHVNNAVYVSWFDQAAWEHSAALGLPLRRCLALDRGMAVVRTTIVYARPALANDAVRVGTWLLPGPGRLQVGRRFQARRAGDGTTFARAQITYACIQLSTGRPVRWPPEFHAAYAPLASVAAAYPAIPPL